MEAFRKVLHGAHERGMKVIMDLVVNHTSDQHEWFQKSRRRIEPYTDYYIWRPAKPNGKLPNNWDSLFEGKAWAWDEVRQEYYMHLFAVQQADLNEDEKERILVVCSYSDREENWKAPGGFNLSAAELILCNYGKPSSTVMKPYETRVYRWGN